MATETLTRGIIGPTGPGSVSPGAIITARGDIIVGGPSATPIRQAVGADGTYKRNNGTDLLNSAILAGDLPTGIDAAKLGGGGLTNAKLAFLADITSAVQAQLNAKAALAHSHILNTERGIYVDRSASSSATPSDNTSSTVTWAVALDLTVTLPTGTWTVNADGSCNLKHSASGNSQFRVSIAGTDSSPRTPDALSSSVYTRAVDAQVLAGQSGTIHVYCHFRTLSGSPGTTFANNPKLLVICERTA